MNLERRQIGEQFRIIDPARMPERPISPDRCGINMMGLLAGLALGLALVALLEYRDTTFKTDEDVVTTPGAAGGRGDSHDDQRGRTTAGGRGVLLEASHPSSAWWWPGPAWSSGSCGLSTRGFADVRMLLWTS